MPLGFFILQECFCHRARTANRADAELAQLRERDRVRRVRFQSPDAHHLAHAHVRIAEGIGQVDGDRFAPVAHRGYRRADVEVHGIADLNVARLLPEDHVALRKCGVNVVIAWIARHDPVGVSAALAFLCTAFCERAALREQRQHGFVRNGAVRYDADPLRSLHVIAGVEARRLQERSAARRVDLEIEKLDRRRGQSILAGHD